jgi:opacity protein-like surface antigen
MRFHVLAATIAAGVSLASSAKADSPWYVSADFGGYFRQPVSVGTTFGKIDDPSVKATGVQTRDFNRGVTGQLAIGYRLTRRLRLEAELGEAVYTDSKIFPYTTDPNFPRLNGSEWDRASGLTEQRFSGAVNVDYDFPLPHGVTPYVGLGVGAWASRVATGTYEQVGGIFNTETPFLSKGASATAGFGQVEAGVAYRITRNWSVVPAYRFVRSFREAGDTANVAKVGLRYAF